MGDLGLKTRPGLGPESLGRGPSGGYRLGMKSLLVALSLALVPALCAASGPAAATAPEGKDQLLAEIESWRDTQLPHVTPADPATARYEPRLDDIKARAQAAKTAKALEHPRRDFQEWKLALMHDKYGTARSRGLADGSFAQFSALQIQQAEFSAALRSQISQRAADQAFVRAQELAMTPALKTPQTFFDGANARGAFGGAAVMAPEPSDPKSPERYAKVREILISQGARPKVVDMAIKEAIRQNADPLLVLSVIKQESGFNPHARSGVGARGLMQIMPGTGRDLGVRNSSALYDIQTNLRAGIRYLKQLWDRFTDIDMTAIGSINPFADHDAKAAVAAYNAGPGAVHRYGGVPPYRETQGYVQKVLGYYSDLKQYLGW